VRPAACGRSGAVGGATTGGGFAGGDEATGAVEGGVGGAIVGAALASGGVGVLARLTGSTTRLIVSASVPIRSPQSLVCDCRWRVPRSTPWSSTSFTTAAKWSPSREASTKIVVGAERKNGSYPRRVATAFRTASSFGQRSAPGPRTYTRRAEGFAPACIVQRTIAAAIGDESLGLIPSPIEC
jgi:hypothetical protein